MAGAMTWYDVLGILPGAAPAGGGLDRPPPVPSGPGADPAGRAVTADMVLAALADVMTAHPAPPRRVTVPDLRGLFVRPALRAAGALGLHLDMIQLTAQPMPVEGLVVDQSPAPGTKARRFATLTVQVRHPPRGRAHAGPDRRAPAGGWGINGPA